MVFVRSPRVSSCLTEVAPDAEFLELLEGWVKSSYYGSPKGT